MTGKYMIMENQQENKQPTNEPAQARPNEYGSILVEGFIRITDPNTKEVLVETRA